MKLFKRKSKKATFPEAKVLRNCVNIHQIKTQEKSDRETLKWLNERLAPYLIAMAKAGASSYDIRDFKGYDRDLVIRTLKSKGYDIDEFGETITIYW